MTGRQLVSFAEMIIAAINDEKLPRLKQTWVYIQKSINDNALRESMQVISQNVQQMMVDPRRSIRNYEDLAEVKNKVRQSILNKFKFDSMLIDSKEEQEYEEQLEEHMTKQFKQLKKVVTSNLDIEYQEITDEASQQIMQDLKEGNIKDLDEFQ